jgi:hypothetical protein
VALMGAAKKKCASCGDGFIGRSNAAYCSPTCRQRAHRGRGARKRYAKRDGSRLPAAHCVEAVALLDELDAELADNSAEQGLLEPLVWSAAEQAVREAIACTVDRKVDLWARYHASDDDGMRVKLSGELRLLETSLARLLKSVSTDLPASPSIRSEKASRAAHRRWQGAAD